MKKLFTDLVLLFTFLSLVAQSPVNSPSRSREHLLFDNSWKFALGHACNTSQDFDHATAYFSYFAKTGYGDGPAAANFDDRAWRVLDLPHDWCVELPFAADGGHSHGYKAIGKNYPENSIGWYRKSFHIPEDDLGRRISIEFDGVFRNSSVWVNGFYLGTEPSGYTGFEYDITDYLNYGGENMVAVRADAMMEEGWYYEGAGIYRHVYLNKTAPLYIDRYGTWVIADVEPELATIAVQTTVRNSGPENSEFALRQTILDAGGEAVAENLSEEVVLNSVSTAEYSASLSLDNPKLWSPGSPVMYTILTEILVDGKPVDQYTTPFGIRTVRFDPDHGFFLNGEHLKLVGVNNHKDHAGVGTALPDALIEWRIRKMQEMGANAIRTSHDPPSPAFLAACDRLGMLVLAENRLTGSNAYHFEKLEDFMKRTRNHPSIVLWSLGNEEWAVEGNDIGIRITESMQQFARTLDTTRAFTTAASGGWDSGTGTVSEVIGYNYIVHGDIDRHHELFPWQPSVGTEETTTRATRGIYRTDAAKGHLHPDLTDPSKPSTEFGWNFYNDREFLSGIFYWTGFDYRGEPTPFAWPAVTSQFGIVDLCGFPKDTYYYLKSWWQEDPVVHLWPHWNWPGEEGTEKTITVYSNCEEVELFLNRKSLGKKTMPRNGHLEWSVAYQPGILEARGYSAGKTCSTTSVETSGEADALKVTADRRDLNADGADVAVITVEVLDKKGRTVPTANIELQMEVEGPGRIIGVGNGNPSSHEPDRYFETITIHPIRELRELPVVSLVERPEVQPGIDDSDWKKAFDDTDIPWNDYRDTLLVVRGTFELEELNDQMTVNLFTKSIVEDQRIYVNGHLIAGPVERDASGQAWELDHSLLHTGENVYAVTGQRFRKIYQWDEPNTDPGLVQVIEPAELWKRKTFNGLAQVLVQSTGEPGEIRLTVKSEEAGTADIVLSTEAQP